MAHLLSIVFQTLRRNLFFFTFIVVVLVSGKWIREEWTSIGRIVDELPSLQRAEAQAEAHRALLARRAARQMQALSGAGVGGLDAEIRRLDGEIRRLGDAKLSFRLPLPEQLAQAAKREVEIGLLRQQRQHLLTLRAYLVASSNRQAAREQLEGFRQAHVNAERALHAAQRQLARAQATGPVIARIPGTPPYMQARALSAHVTRLHGANHRAYLQFAAQRAMVARLPALPARPSFRVDEQALAASLQPLRDRLRQAENLAAENVLWQAWLAARPVLPAAFGVLAGWWLVPAAIRTVFYFVLAPLAARRPPIVVATRQRAVPASPSAPRPGGKATRISAVSRRIMLEPGQELLIRPDYCQSQPVDVKTATELLFDWNRWLTSIAARLWMLKRLHAARPAEIVLSSTTDALDELALLSIAAGEAFVLQPRGLVGMLYETGRRPRIRSHWRLGTLHAWLTLQLRYLSFEGPATLVVKGCRGVRQETAGAGRTISQDAALGFSAHARYATVRAEPFLAYLSGRQPLLHDSFDGPDVFYLYEEVPRKAQAHRRGQNPLEGLFDAGLKAFGI